MDHRRQHLEQPQLTVTEPHTQPDQPTDPAEPNLDNLSGWSRVIGSVVKVIWFYTNEKMNQEQ